MTATHIPPSAFTTNDTMSEFTVSEECVRSLLQQLVVSKACGPDGLSARILR